MDENEKTEKSELPFQVYIRRLRVATDHPLEVFEVEVKDKIGVWVESYATEMELNAFLRGMAAAYSTFGYFLPAIEIPRRISATFFEEDDIADLMTD